MKLECGEGGGGRKGSTRCKMKRGEEEEEVVWCGVVRWCNLSLVSLFSLESE